MARPLPSLDKSGVTEMSRAWCVFRTFVASISNRSQTDNTLLLKSIAVLLRHGLRSLFIDYFINQLEVHFKEHSVNSLWKRFDEFPKLKETSNATGQTVQLNYWIQSTLPQALQEISALKASQEESISFLEHICKLSQCKDHHDDGCTTFEDVKCKYQTSVTALLLTNAPKYFTDILDLYFKGRLENFSRAANKQRHRSRSDDSLLGHCDDIENNNSVSSLSSPRESLTSEYMEINEQQTLDEIEGDDGLFKIETGTPWIPEVVKVVKSLQQLGFSAMMEEACAGAVYSLLKDKIHAVASKYYEKRVLGVIRHWIKDIPLQFVQLVLDSSTPRTADVSKLSDTPSPLASLHFSNARNHQANERVTRWHLRLEFFAYETLGNLRINELFDIIVDYPESLAAIEDLRQCLENTGHHTKLVESFRAALRQRLLTAGAATTDILLQYISTIKALKTMDHTGVFLEAVGEPIREYLKSRKDTIRCIVTMLTEDTSAGGTSSLGGVGESLLEELSRGAAAMDSIDSEDEGVDDDEEAWSNADRWEPDPVEADPSRTSKSRRSMDIIGMLVGIYGSKELFVNEYRIMLAEKLLSKSDYDIDREIRTLELLKLRFGENSMHSCEIMLKDIADSKRINSNIKANTLNASSKSYPPVSPGATQGEEHPRSLIGFVARARGVFSQTEQVSGITSEELKDNDVTLEVLDATIISSLFWPPFQAESIKVPVVIDNLLEEYAQRYHALKTPRKLEWKKNLGIVKLELQFEDRAAQFMVSPMHASIIMLFENRSSWAATDLAAALGVPISTLRRRIMLWVNQGVLLESSGDKTGDSCYAIIENIGDSGNRNGGNILRTNDSALPLLGEDDGESAVASMEDQLQQEMNVYESYVLGMLTNFDSLPLDRIHNMLKMFVSDPPYDKSLQQLQAFLAGLVSEEKLEVRDGLYRRRQP